MIKSGKAKRTQKEVLKEEKHLGLNHRQKLTQVYDKESLDDLKGFDITSLEDDYDEEC